MNNYTAVVNLTADVEDLTLGEREVKKLRVADNTFGKNNEARFFDVIVSSGPDIEVANRLGKGDQIVVSGTLVKSSYKAKKNSKYAKKGQTVYTDSMPFGRILQVTKSETFFKQDTEFNTEELEGEAEGSTDAPDLDESDDVGENPLEGVV